MYSHLIRRIEDIPVLVRTDAERLVDQAFDRVLIPALQHDPAFVSRSFYEWRISLADARAAITEHLHITAFAGISVATAESGLSRSALYGLATRHPDLFKKAGRSWT